MMRFCSEHGDCTPRHGPRYLSFLDETASKFRRRTRAHFGGEIEVITEGFKLLRLSFAGCWVLAKLIIVFCKYFFPVVAESFCSIPPREF